MAKLCPFKKSIKTEIIYGTAWPKEGKPNYINKTEEFKECDMSCMAYDGGICLMMEGNK